MVKVTFLGELFYLNEEENAFLFQIVFVLFKGFAFNQTGTNSSS